MPTAFLEPDERNKSGQPGLRRATDGLAQSVDLQGVHGLGGGCRCSVSRTNMKTEDHLVVTTHRVVHERRWANTRWRIPLALSVLELCCIYPPTLVSLRSCGVAVFEDRQTLVELRSPAIRFASPWMGSMY